MPFFWHSRCKPAKESEPKHQTISIQDCVDEVLYAEENCAPSSHRSLGFKRTKGSGRTCKVLLRRTFGGKKQDQTGNDGYKEHQADEHTNIQSVDAAVSSPPLIIGMPDFSLHKPPVSNTTTTTTETASEDETNDPRSPISIVSLQDFMKEYAPNYSARHRYATFVQLPTAPDSAADTWSERNGGTSENGSWVTTTKSEDGPPRLPSVVVDHGTFDLQGLREELKGL